MRPITSFIICLILTIGCGKSKSLTLQQRIDRARQDMNRQVETHGKYLKQETTVQEVEKEKIILDAYQEGIKLLGQLEDSTFRPSPVIASFYTLKKKPGYPQQHFYVEWLEKNDSVKGFYISEVNKENSPPVEFHFFEEPEGDDPKFSEWTVSHFQHVWFAETEEEAKAVRESMGLQCFVLDSELARKIYEERTDIKIGLIIDQVKDATQIDAIISPLENKIE